MKTLFIAILVCALFPISIQAAENGSEKDFLARDIRIYQLEIIARQERIQRLQQEIQVWQETLREATQKMNKIKEDELRKQEEGKTKGKKEKTK